MSARRGLPLLAAFALAAAVCASPAAAAASVPASASADVDDFSYSSWDSVYELGTDDAGRAAMRVTETLTAAFPEHDQNRGIVRGLPTTYEGASTDTRVVSVEDAEGSPVPYETEEDDDVLYILTGTDDYVHGETTYVITYEMQDVILPARNGVDEFYWDLLPLDSTQPIDAFSADIVLAPELSAHLTGSSACYVGPEGSQDRCDLGFDGETATVEETDLAAGDGVTVGIGLEPGTVVQPDTRLPNPTTDVVPLATSGAAALLAAGGWFATSALVRSRRRATGVIIAQYDVPSSMPPILANAIVPRARNPITAQIIHLAVRGLLRLEELPEGAKDQTRPRLRRLTAPIPDPLDHRALKALFNNDEPDVVMTVPKDSSAFAKRMQGLVAAGKKAAVKRGLTTTARSRTAIVLCTVALGVAAVGLALGIWGAVQGRESAAPGILVSVLIGTGALVSLIAAVSPRTVPTPEGAAALEHLEGVREFIRVAEADRLRMLQSYTGAERRPDGSVDVIHVYEMLLPYAVLFGQEREWGEVLETAYARDQQSPVWANGVTTGLAVRLAGFSTVSAASSSYASPSSGSSSSFGGSTGGGFSGGGGGGGFSGGR
ncbi:DUF2207 domain-containing protein [Microbacterium sp. M28]|uniref:DUF2207 domain-containing protein n=1 Tax=Microbacterium sp. M28 TaxID=2962064 RepID=UPI0021F4B3BB|nr:DUF2207 domain-containing protein [Microbacterium sp. M28]UYO96616.1 DUF2207 domain-containing protein [Microbacterium sp. M28]